MKKLIILFCFLIPCVTWAQDTARGPHGGTLATLAEYKVEVLGCSEYLEVYVFDKYMGALLNFGTSGEVQFFKDDNSSTSEPLVYYGNDGFTARFPEFEVGYFKIFLKIKGVTRSVRFRNECLIRY